MVIQVTGVYLGHNVNHIANTCAFKLHTAIVESMHQSVINKLYSHTYMKIIRGGVQEPAVTTYEELRRQLEGLHRGY